MAIKFLPTAKQNILSYCSCNRPPGTDTRVHTHVYRYRIQNIICGYRLPGTSSKLYSMVLCWYGILVPIAILLQHSQLGTVHVTFTRACTYTCAIEKTKYVHAWAYRYTRTYTCTGTHVLTLEYTVYTCPWVHGGVDCVHVYTVYRYEYQYWILEYWNTGTRVHCTSTCIAIPVPGTGIATECIIVSMHTCIVFEYVHAYRYRT